MKDYYESLCNKHRHSGIFLDTNVLLLYFIGAVDIDLIRRFKRTSNRFCVEDYYTLKNLLAYFSKVITTPHVLTEISNLAGQLSSSKETFFTEFAQRIALLDERYICSADIAKTAVFKKFGLADAGIVYLKNLLVLTEDWALAQYLTNTGVDTINFNHIRTLNWQFIK